LARVLREPPSVRVAARAIVSTTIVIVIAAGVLIRVTDHDEFPNVWLGMWWALETVTTVGYGDVVPKHVLGRIVAALVMLQGLALLAIVTAAITSTFVSRATRELEATIVREEASDLEQIEARFDELERRFDRLEAALRDGS
jgi:voltage-gated potassium channel